MGVCQKSERGSAWKKFRGPRRSRKGTRGRKKIGNLWEVPKTEPSISIQRAVAGFAPTKKEVTKGNMGRGLDRKKGKVREGVCFALPPRGPTRVGACFSEEEGK